MPSTPAASGSTDYSYRGFGVRVIVSSAATGGALSVIEHTLDPGFVPMPLHTHARETETTYVLSGTLTVQVGESVRTFGPGASIVKPAGVRHGFWNLSDYGVRFLELATPGGIEAFYREIAVHIPVASRPNVDEVIATAARYGLDFETETLLDLIERYGVQLV
jgi:quercetin dioxygenase-like cupin family protein